MRRFLFIYLFIVSPFYFFSQTPTSPFEINSILVDGCDGGNEGKNEMVGFIVGPNDINISDLRIDGAGASGVIQEGKWPNNSNDFLGFCNDGNATANLQILNNAILQCGQLVEPAGGVLPAGAKVIIITSTEFTPITTYFENLTETLYVIFQCAGNTSGHFANFNGSFSERALVLHHVPTAYADTVYYDRGLLLNPEGDGNGTDGDAVSYDFVGSPTYFNNGCQAPFIPTEANVTGQNNIMDNAACEGGTINLTGIINGDFDSFTWSGGNGTFSDINSLTPVYQLGAGDVGLVTITFTVNAPCNNIIITNYQFEVDVPFTQALSIDPQGNISLCNGQSTNVTASGGSGIYEWSTGENTSTVSLSQTGVYYVLSENACEIDSISFNVIAGISPSLTYQANTPSCLGECNASAIVNATGGSGFYTYLWDNNAGSATSASVTGLCTGNYICTVSDLGCTTNITVNVSDPIPVSSTNTITNASCIDLCDGTLNISPSGGEAPYTLIVFDPQGNQINTFTNLCGGDYSIQIGDAVGCSSTIQNVNIPITNPLVYSASSDHSICLGESTSLEIDVTQGNPNILWNTGQTNDSISISPTQSTNYSYSLTEGACTSQGNIFISVVDCNPPDSSELVLPNIFTPNNDGDNDEFIPLSLKSLQIKSFLILNRWGNLMIEFKDNNIKWDGKSSSGKAVNEGTYYYIVNYTTTLGEEKQIHGYFQLVRN
ncbi:MAG: gliding motility-associated C-terminal domain-containing protein [Flavobacteriia bacterium]|nr:gliding motility-associated C-terminal domain-containing protein [Flavobacteriia bacterium]